MRKKHMGESPLKRLNSPLVVLVLLFTNMLTYSRGAFGDGTRRPIPHENIGVETSATNASSSTLQ
jgi:hypothetical protein